MDLNTRIEKIQILFSDFKRLLDVHKSAQGNSGWSNIKPRDLDTSLLDFNEYYNGTDFITLDKESNINKGTIFDYPMYCKLYKNDGSLSFGVTPDIGFAKNVKMGSELIWTETTNGLTSRSWTSICYGNDKYVAVSGSNSNTFAYSTDGINWTETTNGLTSRSWSSICYGNGKYVAVASDSNTFAYSTDGINWIETSNGVNNRHWTDICYGNDKFLVTTSNPSIYFTYSTDGINWTEYENGLDNQQWGACCYGGGKFIAVSLTNHNTFAYSIDGITWTKYDNGLTNKSWWAICYGNGKYVVVAYSSNTFAYSTDGINWTETTNGLKLSYWTSICYGNGKYVAVPSGTGVNTFAYSTDGINWSLTNKGLSLISWKSVCYGNNKFVAISNTNTFAYSIDIYKYLPNRKYQEYEISHTQSNLMLSSNDANTIMGGTMYYEVRNSKLYIYPNEIISGSPLDPSTGVEVPISTDASKYLQKNISRLFFIIPKNNYYMRNFFAFVTYYRSSSYGGLVLYITPDFIHWNEHILIPDGATSTDAQKIINTSSSSLYLSSSNAKIIEECISKYFHVLPNNQYLIMYPYQRYKMGESDTYKDKMAVLYSPYSMEPIMEINDPYDYTVDSEIKATNGISAYLDEDGQYVIYYNNLAYPPISLGFDHISNSGKFRDMNGERVNVPIIAKYYKNFPVKDNLLEIDESLQSEGKKPSFEIAVVTAESPSGDYSEINFPAAFINIINDDINHNLYNITKSERMLIIKEKTEYFGNIDEGMENYCIEENLKKIKETNNDLNKREWHSICYGNGKYVAVAFNSDTFAYSTDGINWTETNNGLTSRYWSSICYGNGKYVATSHAGRYTSNTFAYSTDGINWTETTNGLNYRSWNYICYGNGKFVAVSGSNTFAYSTNGINWTETTNGLSSRIWYSVCYGKDKFVAVSGSSTSNTFAYSTDGISWTETSEGLSGRSWYSICYGNGKFVAVAFNSNTFAYSTDGISWIETSNGLANRKWYSVCYGNSKYIAITNNSNTFAYSTDGISWIEINNELTNSGDWTFICYGDGKFVITIYDSNTFAYSDCLYSLFNISNNFGLSQISSISILNPSLVSRITAIGNTLHPYLKENSPPPIEPEVTVEGTSENTILPVKYIYWSAKVNERIYVSGFDNSETAFKNILPMFYYDQINEKFTPVNIGYVNIPTNYTDMQVQTTNVIYNERLKKYYLGIIISLDPESSEEGLHLFHILSSQDGINFTNEHTIDDQYIDPSFAYAVLVPTKDRHLFGYLFTSSRYNHLYIDDDYSVHDATGDVMAASNALNSFLTTDQYIVTMNASLMGLGDPNCEGFTNKQITDQGMQEDLPYSILSTDGKTIVINSSNLIATTAGYFTSDYGDTFTPIPKLGKLPDGLEGNIISYGISEFNGNYYSLIFIMAMNTSDPSALPILKFELYSSNSTDLTNWKLISEYIVNKTMEELEPYFMKLMFVMPKLIMLTSKSGIVYNLLGSMNDSEAKMIKFKL